MNQILISIIIPVHNAGHTILRCLESIIAQSYQEFEVLCIDNGSTDNSYDICNKIAADDARFKVMHYSWSNVSRARNIGLKTKRGDYVTFADADDTLLPDALENFYQTARDTNADIVKSGFETNQQGFIERVCINDTICIDQNDTLNMFLAIEENKYFGHVWNSLIRSSILSGLYFDEDLSWLEDHIFLYQCIKRCYKMILANYITYQYFIQPSQSLSHVKDPFVIVNAANKEYSNKIELIGESPFFKSNTRDLYLERIYKAIRIVYSNHSPYSIREELANTIRINFRIWKNRDISLFTNKRIPFFFRDSFLRIKFIIKQLLEDNP